MIAFDYDEPVRFLVIGAGKMGLLHGTALINAKGAELVGVVSRSEKSAKAMAEKLGNVSYGTDLKAMVALTNAQACIVCVSHLASPAVVRDCLELNLDVLAEKPVAVEANEVIELAELAKQKGCKVMVALNRRFYQVVQSAYLDGIFYGDGIRSMQVSANDHPNLYKLRGSFTNDIYDLWPVMNTIHSFDLISLFSRGIKSVDFHDFSKDQNGNVTILAVFTGENGLKTNFLYSEGSGTMNGWSILFNGKDFQSRIGPLEKYQIQFPFPGVTPITKVESSAYKEGLMEQLNFFIHAVRHQQEIEFPACNLTEHARVLEVMNQIFNP